MKKQQKITRTFDILKLVFGVIFFLSVTALTLLYFYPLESPSSDSPDNFFWDIGMRLFSLLSVSSLLSSMLFPLSSPLSVSNRKPLSSKIPNQQPLTENRNPTLESFYKNDAIIFRSNTPEVRTAMPQSRTGSKTFFSLAFLLS